MTKEFNKLMRKQIEESLAKVSGFAQEPSPKKGWIRTIREALGMPSHILARKLGCTRANITSIEQREVKGAINLDTLNKVAKAMNCKLVYCLVPIESLDKTLEDQAKLIARQRIEMVNHSMKLEQQGLTRSQLQQQEDVLIKELLQGDPRNLWDDI